MSISYRQVIYGVRRKVSDSSDTIGLGLDLDDEGQTMPIVNKDGERRHAYVAVSPEVLEQLDLAQGALGQDLLAEDIGDLLDGNALVRLVVDGGAVGGGSRRQQSVRCETRGKEGLLYQTMP
jgi:hypothetical protein